MLNYINIKSLLYLIIYKSAYNKSLNLTGSRVDSIPKGALPKEGHRRSA